VRLLEEYCEYVYNAHEEISQAVWLPGVINADKVIVQSEKMKKIYVNEYMKAAKEKDIMGTAVALYRYTKRQASQL
jgi:hypothetical protein